MGYSRKAASLAGELNPWPPGNWTYLGAIAGQVRAQQLGDVQPPSSGSWRGALDWN